MIAWLLGFFSEFPGHRLLGYITFRALMAMLTSFLLGIVLGRKLIPVLYHLHFRDKSRDYGDVSTRTKDGTPTMGGLIVFLALILSLVIWGRLDNQFLRISVFAAFWFTALGFMDDYLKSTRGGSDAGLGRWSKLFFQSLFGLILAVLLLASDNSPYPQSIQYLLYFPFFKSALLDLSYFYYPFIVLTIVAIANSINFADGLDGLAAVPAALVAVVYAVFAYIMGNVLASSYLLFPYLPGAGELVILHAALIGGLAAFLWFNCYPAEVFMGDTGSLLLGGLIGTSAVLLKKEFLFLIAGGIFVIEFLSVFIQDFIGIRLLKRRILYRAPIHHTFQFLGLSEPKIVVRFWIVAAIFTLVSLLSIKLQ